jgi:DNA-binding transcriptional LysR family regulator
MTRKAPLGRISDVDIRLLRVFHAVVACRGLSAAEMELNVGRSTISRHLSDLELRLGVTLCERGPAGFSLTPEGERVHEASTGLFSAINSFQSEINDVHVRHTGHLEIALFDKTVSNPAARLPQAIRRFDEIAPKVTIGIHMEPVNVIESGVLTGRFNVAIVPVQRESTGVIYHPLYAEQMYLYCGSGHPLFDAEERAIRQEDVRQHKYAGIGFQSPNLVVSHQLRLTRDADVYDEHALAVLILSGRYLGFLPDHYAKRFANEGAMRRIRPDVYHYQSNHAAVLSLTPKPSRLVQAFLGCLLNAHGKPAAE